MNLSGCIFAAEGESRGARDHVLLGDPDVDDPGAKIWPFKVHLAVQPYDTQHNYLMQPVTSGQGGFWNEFDWDQALRLGAEVTGMDYSGDYGFAATAMYWPQTHMVAPKEDALSCQQCHKENGRLAAITDIYMPGRNNTPLIDKLGWTIALLTLIGVLVHGGIRYLMSKRG